MKLDRIYVMYGIAILVASFFLFKILQRVGIFEDRDDRRDEKQSTELLMASQFNPEYVNKVGGYKPIGDSLAGVYAKQLRVALRGWGTDEDAIFSTFSNLYNKTNISEVSKAYYHEYDSDLKADLMSDLDEEDQAKLWRIISNLPDRTL